MFALLDFFVKNPSITQGCEAVGVSARTFYKWLRNEDHPFFWPAEDGSTALFRTHYATARRIYAIELDASIRETVLLGELTVQTGPNGQVLHEEDVEALAICGGHSDEARANARLLGYTDYPFKHRINANGLPERIPLTLRKPAPANLKIHTARALLASAGFNPATKTEATVDQKVAGAVLVLGATQMGNLKPYHEGYVEPNQPQLEAPKPKTLNERILELQAKLGQQPSALVRDLVERAKQPPLNPRPNAPVAIQSSRADDPPELVTAPDAPAADPQPRLATVGKHRFHPQPAPGGFKVR